MKPTVKVLFAVLLLAFCVVYMGNYAGIAHADPGDTGLPPAPENPFEDAPSGPLPDVPIEKVGDWGTSLLNRAVNALRKMAGPLCLGMFLIGAIVRAIAFRSPIMKQSGYAMMGISVLAYLVIRFSPVLFAWLNTI